MKTKIKIAAVFTFALFALAFFVPKGSMQTKQTVETAGQKFKNIKVLNDMPADQLGKVMNMMSASLGVNCNFCHAENDFAKDGLEHKDAAREMLKMTFELNAKYFDSQPEVNCNTCHQGNPHPQAVFPLAPSTRTPRPVQPEKKPLVEDILTKYETSLGGKENALKNSTRYIKAQRVEPNGKDFEAEEIWQKGNKLLIQTVYPSKDSGDYTVREIFDGTSAKKFGNNAEIALKTDEADAIEREAELFANPNLQAVYKNLEFFRLEKIDGREVFVLNATTADAKRERLYFDAANGLLVRRTASTPTVLGNHVLQVDYLDYKNFDGINLPTTIKFAVPQIYWTRKILAVENNAKVDDGKFIK